MPSVIKRKTSHVAPSGFQIYEGDDPKPGAYRAVIKQCHMQKSNGDNLMFSLVLELAAKDGSAKKEFDGYATFPTIPLTDTEANIQREQAFYLAIGAKADSDTKCAGDPTKFKAGDKQKTPVTSIGGINPVGKFVNVRLRNEPANGDYPASLKTDLIFRLRDAEQATEAAEDDIEDEEDEDGLPLYEEDDLNSKSLIALRKILIDEFEQDAAAMKLEKSKAALIAMVLELQDADEDDEEDDEEIDEEDEDEEEDEEDAEDKGEESAEEAIRAELAEMDRTALKKAILKRVPGSKFKAKDTDDDLREVLVPLMMEDPAF